MKFHVLCFTVVTYATLQQQIQGQTFAGEDKAKAIDSFVKTINGQAIPYGNAVDSGQVDALRNLQQYDGNLNEYVQAVGNDASGLDALKQYFQDIQDADDRMFGEADRTFIQLYTGDQTKCYYQFTNWINTIYVGFGRYKYPYTGYVDYSNSKNQTLEDYCSAQLNDLISGVSNIASQLLGTGQCDALETLYNGKPSSNIWSGYRDFIDDKASYILMYFIEGLTLLNACGVDQSIIDGFNSQYQQAIARIIEYDQKALDSVAQTIGVNLEQILNENQNNTLEIMALNANDYWLSTIYYYDQFLMIAMDNNQQTDEGYEVECLKCLDVKNGDYHVIVDWFPYNSTSTVDQAQLDSIDESLSASEIFTALGCTSGVAKINNDVNFYLSASFFDQYVERQGDSATIIAWGAEGQCEDRT